MLNEKQEKHEFYDFMTPPPAFDLTRWERLRNRVVDELAKGHGMSLSTLADIAGVEEGQLRIWLHDASEFRCYGRRVGEKSRAEEIAEALDNAFAALDAKAMNPAQRCPVRVQTSVVDAIVEAFGTARNLCEFVEISAPSGVGKSEGRSEAIARYRKEEGFFCPVWSIVLDETCVTLKAILTLIARAVCERGSYDDKSEFSLSQSIIEAAEGRHGVLAIDEGQHLADVMKKLGIPIVNQLRSFVDRGLFGVVYFGNGEIYRRLVTGTGRNKGAYTQILSRMQDFRVEISGYCPGEKKAIALTKSDVLAIAAAWGVTGAEEQAWCLKVAATQGALRTMTNIFRKVLEKYDAITITHLNSIRSF